jgi:hypothetical protein
MRSDSYVVEVDEDFWVLHVFDVEGEDDVLAIQLRLGSREECDAFPDAFEAAVMRKSKAHPVASGCPECRPSDRDRWISLFTDWVKDAYSDMPTPPTPVEAENVPEVVRLSMECVYRQGDEPETSSVN